MIARQIGVNAGDELRLLVAEVDEKHPFVQLEMLMPVLPLVRVPDAAEAIAMAKRVEHGFAHTAVMYSRNIAHLHAMARTINTSIFVKNASNLAGLGLRRRGLHVVHHRVADGRGADHGAQLHARAALHAEGILPDCLTATRRSGDGAGAGAVELSSIARGHRVADAMLKRAPVRAAARRRRSAPGSSWCWSTGDVAAVDESFRVGTDVAGDRAVDKLFLPQPHAALWPALAGEARAAGGVESLGIVETTTVAATVRAADAAAKAARVRHHRDAARARHRRQGVLHRHRAARPRSRPPSRRRSACWTRRWFTRPRSSPAPHADLVAKLR